MPSRARAITGAADGREQIKLADDGTSVCLSTRDTALVDFGSALRAARRSRGWSLQQAAAAVDMHVSTLSRIECGRIAPNFFVRDRLVVLFADDALLLRELGKLVRPDWLPSIEAYLIVKYELSLAAAARVSKVLEEVIEQEHRA